ncbi:MAG TPA: sulfatase [bacterium]|nr:sulfatase [bacterium]
MSEETHKKETGPAGLSWLTVEGFILAIAAVLSLIPGIREMIDNEYLARGMRQTAQLMFAAEYWSMFQILFPLGQVFLFFLWRFSKRLPTFGQTLGFTALYFGSMGLIQVVSTLVILNIMVNNISRFEMLVHNFPAPVGAAMGQIADYMFQPLQLQPLYLIKFLSLAPVPLLTYVAVHLGFGLLLATTIWQGVRYYRAARQGLKLPKEKRSIQLPPVSRRHWWIFLVILLPVTVAWIDEPAENNVAFGHPNILLISIDTLRADHVGCYGHTRDTTPMIDHLASEGMIFDRAISQSSWTLPSHVSMLTGFYPIEHGCNVVQGITLSNKVTTLAEYLLEAGYHTMAVTSSHFVSPIYNLDQGFEDFSYNQSTAERLIRVAAKRIDTEAKRPFFMFLHLFDPHDPYTPPEEFRDMFVKENELRVVDGFVDHAVNKHGHLTYGSRELDILERLYDAEIRFTDDQLGFLFNHLWNSSVLNNTIVIITSDHGESFGENNEIGHGSALYSQQIHVPLIIRFPPRIPGGTRSNRLVEASTQLLPTILDLAGLPIPPGKYRLSMAADDQTWEQEDNRAFAETAMPGVAQYSFQNPEWKTIAPLVEGSLSAKYSMLFAPQEDWGDRNNLAPEHPDVVQKFLYERLEPYLELEKTNRQPGGAKVRLSPADIEKLRSLGYIQ